MTEPSDSYSDYFDANDQPVRRGVVLTDTEAAEYATYFADETTTQTITEESA